MILLFLLFLAASWAHPGAPIPPKEVAREFFGRFTKAVNDGNVEEIKKLFAPTFVENAKNTKYFENITQEIGGYTWSIEYAVPGVFEQPNNNTHILNGTVFFRGPHPTYIKKNFDFTLQNIYKNPQMSPLTWQVKSLTMKPYSNQKFFQQSQQEPIIWSLGDWNMSKKAQRSPGNKEKDAGPQVR
uniref:DUF4440 domain-containing protein n=1 Tax=Caenorhabditis tropicalis TaxID=1561998 RepID=A0A1I7UKP2_9PELO